MDLLPWRGSGSSGSAHPHHQDRQTQRGSGLPHLVPSSEAEQDTLLDAWRYHAFITNSDLGEVDADRINRGHAIIERVIAALKGGPLAYLSAGRFTANAAWLQFAVIAHNISHAAATAASLGRAHIATLLHQIVLTPARLATTGRHLVTTYPHTGLGRGPGHGWKPQPVRRPP